MHEVVKQLKATLAIAMFLSAIVAGTSASLFGRQEDQTATYLAPPGAAAKVDVSRLAKVRLPFTENQGQLDREVRFYTATFAGTVFVTDRGLTYALIGSASQEGESPRGVAVKETFLSQKALRPIGSLKSDAIVNYFLGEEERWRSNVPTYDEVGLGEVWSGVEVKLRAYGKNVEKTFEVQPGGRVGDIRLSFEGVRGLAVDGEGRLLLETELGTVAMTKPLAFQDVGRVRRSVEASYVVDGSAYGFAVGHHDPRVPLVIDPLLASTFIGGDLTGGFGDLAQRIALDASGNVFLVGSTDRSDYPTTSGAFDTVINGGLDVVVSKLNSGLTSLLASTFIGGMGNDDGTGVALDGLGNVFVTGITDSGTYPTIATGLDTTFNGGLNSFVSKFNNALTSLLASTFIGGTSSDDRATGVILDGSGNAFVTGLVQSSSFATTAGAFDTGFNGAGDVFITKLDNGLTTRLASTFLGGSTFDTTAGGLAFDSAGNLVLAGNTDSSNFPTTGGAFDTSCNSCASFIEDVFVSKLNSGLTSLLASTFLGGSAFDGAQDLVLDGSDNVFVVGQTLSSDFPTTLGAFDTGFNGGFDDGYVSKLNSGLTSLLASTFLGGSAGDFARAVALDSSGSVFVAGRTASATFPTTLGALDPTANGGLDAFISKLNSGLTSLLASTFLGGFSLDELADLARDASGNVFVAGLTSSSDYPTTAGAYDTTFSASDLFVSKISGDLASVIIVSIDIKPGSFPNAINPQSRGKIPVAILTTSSFDAGTVDSGTVTFGPDDAPATHSAMEDVDGDGDLDLLLQFNTQETGIACGQTSAILHGQTLAGVPIEGSDSIVTVPCPGT